MLTKEKTCDNCMYSYEREDQLHLLPGRRYLQHCGNRDYNSDSYTHEMRMEDRGDGHCRFWTPKILKL